MTTQILLMLPDELYGEAAHVAIYKGELIDHDADGVALSQRVYEKYPDKFILIRQVEVESDRILHFRSPRLVRN